MIIDEPMQADPQIEVPPVQPVDTVALRRKARFGVIALAARSVLLQVVVLGGNVYLYRLLKPSDFGAYAIVRWVLIFFAFLGEAGLGAALIQKKEEPTQRELSSVFWLQLGIALVLVAGLGLGAPYLVRFWPDLTDSGVFLLRTLAFDLLLTAFRVIPTILMERHLQFGRLAIVDVVLALGFNATAVVFALRGDGARAFGYAVLVQGTCGIIATYLLRPWFPSLALDRAALRPLVRFGSAFQGANVLAFLVSAINPIYAGRWFGQRALGHINWAMDTACFPLNLVTLMTRVNFPLFSRLQHDPELLARSVEKAVLVCAIFTFASAGIFLGLGPSLVRVIYTDQWLPALPLFYIYIGVVACAFLTPILMTAVDAGGRPQLTFRVVLLSAILVWTMCPLAAHWWGPLGFAAAYGVQVAIVAVTTIVVTRRQMPLLRLWPQLRVAVVGGVLMAVVGRWLLRSWSVTPLLFVLAVVIEIGLFVGLLALLDRAAFRQLLDVVRRKSL